MEIRAYIDKINETSLEDDLLFLDEVGMFLIVASREELKRDGVILQVEALMLNVIKKFYKKGGDYPGEIEDLFRGVKSYSQSLGQKTMSKEFTQLYYEEVYKLGQLLVRLAEFANSVAVPLYILSKFISN